MNEETPLDPFSYKRKKDELDWKYGRQREALERRLEKFQSICKHKDIAHSIDIKAKDTYTYVYCTKCHKLI